MGRRHMLRCMGDLGICRPACRQSEEPYLYCRNYQSCCLPSYVRIDISGKEGKNDWNRENRWPKVS
ncbi:beta-defensin 119 [Muntiacus reevesi]|uniref:beta-defensin 119 n=1 Tax=Muntiacus reevesi TaxID=9886 RepID=UPI0033078648